MTVRLISLQYSCVAVLPTCDPSSRRLRSLLPPGQFILSPGNTWVGSTVSPSRLTNIDLAPTEYWTPFAPASGGFQEVDFDGSLTSTPGAYVVADVPFSLPPPTAESGMTCSSPVGNSRVCSPSYNPYVLVSFEDYSYVTAWHGRGGRVGSTVRP